MGLTNRDEDLTQGSVIVPPKSCVDMCKDCSYHCKAGIVPVPTVDESIRRWMCDLGTRDIGMEIIPVACALGRITAKPVLSLIDIPSANCATHDGIAVKRSYCEGLAKNNIYELRQSDYQHCPMGTVVPPEFDSIIHAEQCVIHSNGTATFFELPILYQSVQLKGTSISKDECILSENVNLTPSDLAILQYTGHTHVCVKKRPSVFIIPLGDDLKPPGMFPSPGESIDCDSIYIHAFAKMCGADGYVTPIVPDDENEIEKVLHDCLVKGDIIITIGGIGKGEQNYGDCTLKAIRKFCKISAYGVKLGPGGKNMLLAGYENKPVIGIPGPPHAALIMTENFLPPAIEYYYGCPCYDPPVVEVCLEHDFPARGDKDSIWEPRVCLRKTDDGLTAHIVEKLGDTVSNFIEADASISVTGSAKNFHKGCRVHARLIRGERTISFK